MKSDVPKTPNKRPTTNPITIPCIIFHSSLFWTMMLIMISPGPDLGLKMNVFAIHNTHLSFFTKRQLSGTLLRRFRNKNIPIICLDLCNVNAQIYRPQFNSCMKCADFKYFLTRNRSVFTSFVLTRSTDLLREWVGSTSISFPLSVRG